jgi:hypothetical protein
MTKMHFLALIFNVFQQTTNATSIEFLIFRLEKKRLIAVLMLLVSKKLFGQTGSTRKRGSERPTKRTLEVIDAVEELMENEPQIVKKRMIFEQAT